MESDANAVRPRARRVGEEVVPLRPAFAHLAIGVERVQKVLLHDAAIGDAEHVDPREPAKPV